MKILFCSRWFPYPPDNGSRLRIFNLIKQLASQHEVDLISFTSGPVADDSLAAMQQYCRNIDIVRYKSFDSLGSKALFGFFSKLPRSVVDTYSLEMQQLVNSKGRNSSYDVIIASQSDMAFYMLSLPGVLKIFEEVEFTTLYERFFNERNPFKRLRNGLTWWKLSRYMTNLLSAFNGCTVVSERERARVLDLRPNYDPIGIVPNGVDIARHRNNFGSPEADTLIYSGALTYTANFDAMRYFLGEVFPLIQAKHPQVKLYITGKLDGVPINRLPRNEGVIFTGYVDDIRPKVAQSWVTIVPLRQGGGTRLKILESLALGTPVVATSKGAEGLDLVSEQDLLIADKPAEFASAVLRILDNRQLREKLGQNGRQVVTAKYDWQIIGKQFNQFIEQVVSQKAQS
jgi:glycosyltransferase involved in cell wall biosynthesis